MYSLRLKRSKWNKLHRSKVKNELKFLKGVSKVAVKNQIHFANYRKCLLQSMTTYAKYHKIDSKKHQVRTVKVSKKALNSFDDKR